MLEQDWYIDTDGYVHWSDCRVGSKLVFDINLNTYLTNENDTLVGDVTWTLPTGLTEGSYKQVVDNRAYIQIEADTAGTYEIKLEFDHKESVVTQTQVVKIYLTVFA